MGLMEVWETIFTMKFLREQGSPRLTHKETSKVGPLPGTLPYEYEVH